MEILISLFLFSLVLGQIGAWRLENNITIYSHDLVLLILLLSFFIFKFKKPKFNLRLKAPILAFAAAAAWSLIFNYSRFSSSEIIQSSLYLGRWFTYAGIYFLVVASAAAPIFWLNGLYGVGTSLAVLGLIQYVFYPELRNLYYLGWDEHYYRVFSTILDPNFLGILLVLTIFLGFFLWKKFKFVWIFLLQAINVVVLLLTYSRSSYLAFLLGIAVFFLKTGRWRQMIIVAAVFFLALLILPQPAGEGVRLSRTVSAFARLGNWQKGFELIKEAPLFGHGFNTLRFVQGQTISKAGAGLDSSLQFVWATTGVVGLVIYLWLLKNMFKLGRLAVVTLISLLVHSLFVNSLFYPLVMIWVWILVGAIEKGISADN